MCRNKIIGISDVVSYLDELVAHTRYFEIGDVDYDYYVGNVKECMNVLNYLFVKKGFSDYKIRSMYSLLNSDNPDVVEEGLLEVEKQIKIWKGVF